MLKRIGSESERARLAETLKRVDGVVTYQPVKLRDGAVSDYYVDVKKVMGDPLIRRDTAKIIVRHIGAGATFVAASGYGGVPLATEISTLARLPLSMVRDREKDHGKGGLVDGFAPTHKDSGIIVDDVLTTGGSIAHTREVLIKNGASVSDCFVVVNRGDPPLGFDVSYILKVEDI